MKTIILIPARYASSRYPGKPLAKLKGASGIAKTLLQRSIEAARNVRFVDQICVTTDDERIAHESHRHDCDVIMTSETCRNGTERVSEAVSKLEDSYDLIINLQGDAPLTPPWFVESLIDVMANETDAKVATPVLACDQEALHSFKNDRKNGRVGATTCVFNAKGNALYFSKEVVPYSDSLLQGGETLSPVYHHVGLYAYRTEALNAYNQWPVGPLEAIEGLEQLRYLENGYDIRAVKVEARGAKFWELNNPQDVPLIETYLKQMGWE